MHNTVGQASLPHREFPSSRRVLLVPVLFQLLLGAALAGPEIKISRQIPCNLFPLESAVRFETRYAGLAAGDELKAVVADEARQTDLGKVGEGVRTSGTVEFGNRQAALWLL